MPTVLQTAPFGHSGNLPCCLIAPAAKSTIPTSLQRRPTVVVRREIPLGRMAGWKRPQKSGVAMAAESSFDVVSKVDRQEVDNALNQAAKEVRLRFDFETTDAGIRWSGETIEMEANSEERVKAVLDV